MGHILSTIDSNSLIDQISIPSYPSDSDLLTIAETDIDLFSPLKVANVDNINEKKSANKATLIKYLRTNLFTLTSTLQDSNSFNTNVIPILMQKIISNLKNARINTDIMIQVTLDKQTQLQLAFT